MSLKFASVLFALLCALSVPVFSRSGESPTSIVFVGDAERAVGSSELLSAYAQLGQTGGAIVVRGEVRLHGDFVAPAHAAPVTITSRDEGREDQLLRGARLVLGGDYTINGPTTFATIDIAPSARASRIYCNGFPVVFGEGVSCEAPEGGRLPSIVGAAPQKGGRTGADVTIQSGHWDLVVGGTLAKAEPTSGDLRLTIHGGRFDGIVGAVGFGRHAGDAMLTMNDGSFYGGIVTLGNDAAAVRGNIHITVNGGIYHNVIAASQSQAAEFYGTYNLTVNDGVFTSLTGILGASGLPGTSTSVLTAAPALLDQKNTGALTFNNPLIKGADPWVFMHDGFYYAISTGYDRLVGRKVANLGDLPHATAVPFFAPVAGQPYSRHLWSPKIYHFDSNEVGPEHTGFYLYFTANDGSGRSALDHRLFVLRSLTDDPIGPYGSPLEGERDIPTRVTSANGQIFNDEWVAGPKVLNYKGKQYLIWVGRVGGPESKNVGDHWQCLYIDELINPWTVAGRAAMICRPTLAWEKHGAGMTGSGDQRRMLPEVVEGGTPVLTEDGTLYLLYAGSGYWTPYYAIGLMKLVGSDPMNPAHWQKSPEPIFKASEEVVGSANACYVSSPTGKSHWAIYHAYVGQKTKGVPRQLFAEPYLADRHGMSIGRGTPASLGAPMTIEANPMPLRKKISGFSTP